MDVYMRCPGKFVEHHIFADSCPAVGDVLEIKHHDRLYLVEVVERIYHVFDTLVHGDSMVTLVVEPRFTSSLPDGVLRGLAEIAEYGSTGAA